ncbi:MAG: sulfurtransferase TusA family protein [Candidatus Abyssobacteria bacterium SURF_5]|uniref:Sulfurtransferase TusA family protein n=1 Tax=Abyssobacteria bacterium (strain SURF_5) TaxID=2093360 RepID=A0A3A4NTY9_ABYX5|nr:MAG: sulfurtransferase TusA family protein [Candidatus Abyssubacteria bacterium SURF_5]
MSKMSILDLTDTQCPMTFIKAKLAIEELEAGQLIELLVNPGTSMRDVPRSLKEEGHRIERVVREQTHFRVTVRKQE